MTSLSKLQAVSKCQAQLIELYEAKVSLLGAISADTSKIVLSRPGARVTQTIDPALLDFVNTSGRRKDENKANYAVGLQIAERTTTASDWEQVDSICSQCSCPSDIVFTSPSQLAQKTTCNLEIVARSCELSSFPRSEFMHLKGSLVERLEVQLQALSQQKTIH